MANCSYLRMPVFAIGVIMNIAFVNFCVAQIALDLPGKGELSDNLSQVIPSYWDVKEFRASDPVQYGDAVDPLTRWRIEVEISPKESLYSPIESPSVVSVLFPSMDVSDSVVVYGVVSASYYGGEWSINFDFENTPFSERGKPIGFFPGPFVIAGTDEEEELYTTITDRLLSDERDRAAVEISRIEAESEAAMTRIEAEHAALVRKMNVDLETATASHEAYSVRLELEHAATLEARAAEHAAELELLRLDADAARQAYEQDMALEVERLKSVSEAAQMMESLAESASTSLRKQQEAEVQMLALLDSSVEARADYVAKLVASAETSDPDRFTYLIDAASVRAPEWVVGQIIRHGILSEVAQIRQAAIAALPLLTDPVIRKDLTDLIISAGLPPFEGLEETSQWASEILDFSAQYDNQGWSAAQVLGPPTIDECGDIRGSWTVRESEGLHYVKIGFDQPMYPSSLSVHQNNSVGFVRRIVLHNADGSERSMDVEDTLTECPGVSSFPINDHPFLVEAVTVVVDAGHGTYVETDAISLSGYLRN